MADEFGRQPGRTQATTRSNLRVVSNLELDPATAEAKRRLLKPEPKPRSPHEPMIIGLLVVIAVVTMTIGYLGGRNNTLFAATPAAGDGTAAAPVIAPETSLPNTTTLSSPTTRSPTTTNTPPPDAIEPPQLGDDFDAEFAETFAAPERLASAAVSDIAETPDISATTQPPEPESSVERSSKLAAGIASALEGRDPDTPVLSSGTVIDLAAPQSVTGDDNNDNDNDDNDNDRDTAAGPDLGIGAEFIALSTDIFGSDVATVTQLDESGDAFEIDGGIRFGYKSRTIDDQYLPFLDRLATLMEQRPNLTLAVLGHTDSRGDAAKNRKLSQARADSVVAYLMFRGIDADRLTALGEGANKPVASNDTEAGRELNRRIQLLLDRRPS